jgi:glycosyltransferase involved in cell wall biosynthesis
VGTDFPHQNLRSLVAGHAVLRARWQGPGAPPALVLAGAATRTAGSVYGVPPDRWPPGVRYVGAVDDAALLALYQEARAFAFLSSYEGFGLPLLEAMASGVPVVCARATSVPEVAGDAALYVETFDREEIAARLRDACGDGPVRARAIEAGLRRAASFTWRETARRTVEVYLEAIERPPAASLIDREHLAALLAG